MYNVASLWAALGRSPGKERDGAGGTRFIRSEVARVEFFCFKAKIALFYQISYLGYISCQENDRIHVDAWVQNKTDFVILSLNTS